MDAAATTGSLPPNEISHLKDHWFDEKKDHWMVLKPQLKKSWLMPGVYFEPLSLEMLIDQPLLAGRYFKQIDLTPGTKPEHVIDIAADSEAALAMTPARVQNYQRVPGEFAAMFAGRVADHARRRAALPSRSR